MKNLFFLLLLGLVLFPTGTLAFSDVYAEHRFEEEIKFVQDQNIVKGFADGTFKPEQTITRAEFTKIIIGSLFSATDIATCDLSKYTFYDVYALEWFAPYVCQAKKAGIINGYADGSFKPQGTITLPEAMKIVLIGYNKLNSVENELQGLLTSGQLSQEIIGRWYTAPLHFFETNLLGDRQKFPFFQEKVFSQYDIYSDEALQYKISRGEMAYFIALMNPEKFFELKTFTGKFTSGNTTAKFSFLYSDILDPITNLQKGDTVDFIAKQEGDTVKIGQWVNTYDAGYLQGWEMNIGNDISDKEKLITFLRPLYGKSCTLAPQMKDLGNKMYDVILEGTGPDGDCFLNYAYAIRYTPNFGGKVVAWDLGQDRVFAKNNNTLDKIMVDSFKFSE
ncbi:MAG: S-layer homology domain-containing protein [Candidatus Peregrinibacteria bacterium]